MKHVQYLKYLIRHKWYVMLACFSRGLYWQGIVHDLSKFRPREWMPYAEFFYGPKYSDEEVRDMNRRAFNVCCSMPYETKEEKRDKFNLAWLHHQRTNPHHWQFWILRNDDGSTVPLKMPEKYILEMLCDWEGAGMAITGKREYVAWYMKNRLKMLMHPDTRWRVEKLLKIPIDNFL